jgi:hypothetical protein
MDMTERVQEFTRDGKTFITIDFSGYKTSEELLAVVELAKTTISAHPENSVYTVTDATDIRLDAETKEYFADYMKHNKPYVKYGAVIGIDGAKKMIVGSAFKLSERANMHYCFTKEQAIEWLKGQE